MKKILQNKILWFFLCVGIFTTHIGWTQDRQITGKVTETDKSALPGASILIKGTTRGTTTNSEGLYKISAKEGATLIITSLGYEKKEVKVGTENVINISLNNSPSPD